MSGYSYTWRKRRGEDLARFFHACARCEAEDQPFGLYSELERAHLDGDRKNDAPDNVAVLCRTCHRRHDIDSWLAAYRAWLAQERIRRAEEKDKERPILEFLKSLTGQLEEFAACSNGTVSAGNATGQTVAETALSGGEGENGIMSAPAEYKVDKSTWGDGPWQQEPDRVDWVHAGLACLALRDPGSGVWCGYAAVPREHPAYGKPPNEVDADVHQGVNYANRCSGLICHTPAPGMPDDVWWFGFDCGHSFDLSPARDARERERGMETTSEMHKRFSLPMSYCTFEYVRQEIEGLAEQLAKMVEG